jgi:DNA adenine methylase
MKEPNVFGKRAIHLSPLRYPGGKAFLLDYLSQVISFNNPIETYIEPFAGGAGAALGLLVKKWVSRIILNEVDDFLYYFWQAVIHRTEELVSMIERTPVDLGHWKRMRSILTETSQEKKTSFVQKGFAAFYLNRCNRSGILMAGPIGGYSQKGVWRIDARFNKGPLIERIRRIATYGRNIEIYNSDAVFFLSNIIPKMTLSSQKTLIYLDPPYFDKGPTLYRRAYSERDHIELRDLLRRTTNFRWVLSYDDVPFIHRLYDGTKKKGINVNHFAYRAKIGKELLISSDNCKIPGRYASG